MESLDALTPEGFAEIQRETLEKQIKIWPMRSWYPSSAGASCDRQLVWRWTKFDQAKPHTYYLESIFREGRLHQPDVMQRLTEMGFDLVPEQDRPSQWKFGNVIISGRPDGKIRGFRGERFEQDQVLEIKTMQGHIFDRINTIDDLANADSAYLRAYVAQGNLYCLLDNLQHGVFVLKSKASGLLKLLPFEVDMASAEQTIQRIERMQEFVDAKTDPPPIDYDERICRSCGFNDQCWPAKDLGPGLQLLEDAQLLEDITESQKLKPAAAEYTALDKSVKARLKRLGEFEAAAIGQFVIVRKEVSVKEYKVNARTDVRFEIRDNSPASIAAVVKEIEG